MRQRRNYKTDESLLDEEDDDDDDDDDDDCSSASSEAGNCNWKVLTGIFIIQVCSSASETQNHANDLSRSNIEVQKH
jgi:hypothetical protein